MPLPARVFSAYLRSCLALELRADRLIWAAFQVFSFRVLRY
jgi:hypothetical protein